MEGRDRKAEHGVQENPCKPRTVPSRASRTRRCTAPARSTSAQKAEAPRRPHLLPDVVVAEEAADLSPGQGPGGVRVPVTREHVDAESLELTRVQRSGKERISITI